MNQARLFLTPLLERAALYAPKAAFVLAILIGGALLSALARRVIRALVRRSGLEALAERAGIARLLYAFGAKHGFASFLGGVAYAAGLALTLSAASDALGLTVVSALTSSLVAYLPRLLGAGGLLVGAIVCASFVRNFVQHVAARRGDVDSPKATAKIAYAMVVVIGSLLAAEQAGIEVAFLTTLLQIALGIVGVGLALAFALGFYTVFRNMAARHYYKPLLRVGQVVRVGEDEGTVVRFGPTAMVIRTADGERIVPCSRFLHTTVHVQSGDPPPPPAP